MQEKQKVSNSSEQLELELTEEVVPELSLEDLESEMQQPIYIINNIDPKKDEKDNLRSISLYGDINEHMANEVMQALLFYDHTKNHSIQEEDGTIQEVILPIRMYVSTHGGVVSDMFSIIDVMENIKANCDIETIGVGKVMSAGVLVLAAGTKGKRKIAKHCRVMLHSVMSGHCGSFPNLENEMKETKHMQNMYFDFLSKNTKLSKKRIKKLLIPNVDVYLSAEEAIKYGIADEIM
tara:strand:+ start:385 stop:1092 length:708 start_codon:yes stop_codon:yes gene_type:complete